MSSLSSPTDTTAPLRVLIVEDSATVAVAISVALSNDGMQTRLAQTGADGLAASENFKPDMILLDLELPDVNGMDLLGRFSAVPGCGVIVVTASGAEAQRIAGLDLGADDYIVKPAPLRELAARIRAVHRRLTRSEPQTGETGHLRFDMTRRLLLCTDQRPVLLTEAEAEALTALLQARGQAVSRARLSEIALKRPLHDEDRSVDQIVLKLRRKITSLGASSRTILSMRRTGYAIPLPSPFQTGPGL